MLIFFCFLMFIHNIITMFKNFKNAFLITICIIIISVISSLLKVINDKDVYYDNYWTIIGSIVLVIVLIYLFYLLWSYYNNIEQNKTVYLMIFIIASAYLLSFGFISIFKNELLLPETDPMFFIKNMKNDNIAIYSLLVGFITAFLCFVDLFSSFIKLF